MVAVYGSPRRTGNTARLLSRAVEGARSMGARVEEIALRDLNMSPCLEIYECKKTGQCVFNDMLNPLFDKLLSYERVVFSYPLFFLGPPAVTKGFIDRGQFLWVRKYLLGQNPVKPGIERKAFLLSVGGFKGGEKVFRCNRSILKSFLPVCGLTYAGELFRGGIEGRDDVHSRQELCREAEEAGRMFVR